VPVAAQIQLQNVAFVPPVVAMDRAQIVRLLGPTMQRYVIGKL
jgi:hypothetical protein